MYNAVAENVLGTIGTVLWCVQLIPQIIRNYRVKDCTGFPPLMMFLWAASGVPFSVYFIATNGAIPLRIQPQLFTFFCMVSWFQSLYYPPIKMPVKKVTLMVGTFCLISLGLEIGFILWLRPLYERGIEYPMLIVGIVASVLLAVGLFPPYYELSKRRGRVVGINFIFLTVDAMGALTSLLSIVVGTMDTLSMILYAIVLALEIGIFTSQIIWYFFLGGKKIIKQEKEDKRNEKQRDVETIPDTESIEGSGSDTVETVQVTEQTVLGTVSRTSHDKPV